MHVQKLNLKMFYRIQVTVSAIIKSSLHLSKVKLRVLVFVNLAITTN
jgi:hypothetical protein